MDASIRFKHRISLYSGLDFKIEKDKENRNKVRMDCMIQDW